MTRVDYCITTMDRPRALERLLFSIAAHSPEAPIHVADQSKRFDRSHYERLGERLQEAGLQASPIVHRLPFDCGLSVARNHLVDSISGEYMLNLDDDFMFTDETDVGALAKLLGEHPEAGLVGGAVTRMGHVRHVGTRFERHRDFLLELPCDKPFQEAGGLRVKQADFIPFFALMRAQLFERLRWDAELKTGGGPHLDFFLSMLEIPETVLFTPDVKIDHPPIEIDPAYRQLRLRGEFLGQALAKHGLSRVTMVSGATFELHPDGDVIAYCELDRSALAGGAAR